MERDSGGVEIWVLECGQRDGGDGLEFRGLAAINRKGRKQSIPFGREMWIQKEFEQEEGGA